MKPNDRYDLVVAGSRVLWEGRLRPGWLALRDGVLSRTGTGKPPEAARRIEAGADAVGPPLVDTHVHGFGGFDASACGDPVRGEETLRGMARALLGAGVGAFCPTLYPLAPEAALACLRTIARVRASQRNDEAAVVGAHLEGPFVSPARPGALDPRHIAAPDARLAERLAETGAVAIVTLAPELAGAEAVIRAFASAGSLVSMGHTLATWDHSRRACAAGAGAVTHLFNAMPGLHHRDLTLAHHALLDGELSVELVPDRTHVSAAMIDLVLRVRGLDRLRFVSDNLAAAGTGARAFEAGGSQLSVREGIAYLESGTIAGSCQPLAASVRGLARTGLLSLEESWRLASEEPARAVEAPILRGFCRIPA